MGEVSYRTMTTADIDAGLRLCRAVRWNQLRRDWEMFLARSPEACRVACSNGEVIGTSATIRYDDRFSWIGMVLVDPAERGRGTGTRLLLEALDVLKHEESVRLDATPAGERIYRNFDFREEYWLSRMQATVAAAPPGRRDRRSGRRPPAISMKLRGSTAKFLAQIGGSCSSGCLKGLRSTHGFVLRDRRLRGIFSAGTGSTTSISDPWSRAVSDIAEALLSTCLRELPGKSVILDAPRSATGWLERLASFGFAEQRPFIRMYKGSLSFPGSPGHQYAILGPEFG